MNTKYTPSSMAARPRRSLLYMPGANRRALAKAVELPADGLIFDLEDSVAAEAKAAARQQICAAVVEHDYGARELVVRVNAGDTPWYADDLRTVAGLPVDAILLPKVETAAQVEDVLARIPDDNTRSATQLWIMAETPRGILNLDTIAGSSSRLSAIVMGNADLAKGMRIEPGPERTGLLPALSHAVLTARAHGLDILDGVHTDLKDPDGFERVCRQGKTLGFDGKTLIHPDQIGIANKVFGVSAETLARAEAIVAAWEAQGQGGQGIIVVNGRMIEALHVDDARRVLAMHASIRARAEGDR